MFRKGFPLFSALSEGSFLRNAGEFRQHPQGGLVDHLPVGGLLGIAFQLVMDLFGPFQQGDRLADQLTGGPAVEGQTLFLLEQRLHVGEPGGVDTPVDREIRLVP